MYVLCRSVRVGFECLFVRCCPFAFEDGCSCIVSDVQYGFCRAKFACSRFLEMLLRGNKSVCLIMNS